MRLSDLDKYNDIVIQCHDNPDADAIASGFGLYHYFKSTGKSVRFIYGGKSPIRKGNLLLMIEKMEIPLEYVNELGACELLLLCDCQYGEGNVQRFEADSVAMIDHHEICVKENELTEIRPGYGSCATVVYSMLIEEEYDINDYPSLATALYYGLYMDTNCFAELKHPCDTDLMETILPNEYIINNLKGANFSLYELQLAGVAILNHEFNEKNRTAVVRVEPCDPNILGFISDLLLQVDCVDICIAFSRLEYGYKLSVRSCRRDVTARDLAGYLTNGIGNGGGHKNKAGGFILHSKYDEQWGEITFSEFILQTLDEYFDSYECLDAEKDTVDRTDMLKYRKLPIPVGYAKTLDFASDDTVLVARTLEGDVSLVADEDTYIMIGIDGEVYPIRSDKFNSSYNTIDEPYVYESEYLPTVHNRKTNEVYKLLKYAKSCVSNSESYIYARKLEKTTKVFTGWHYDNYMLGNKGDYLAVRGDDGNDVYIIKRKIMEISYKCIG